MEIVYEFQNNIVLRFDKGDHYNESFVSFLEDMEITSAFFHGLGGFLSAKIAFYDLEDKQEYIIEEMDGPLEVANLTGNVAQDKNGDPTVHNHVVVAGEDYEAVAGHLVDGVVGGTLELHLQVLDNGKRGMERTLKDDETDLTLLE